MVTLVMILLDVGAQSRLSINSFHFLFFSLLGKHHDDLLLLVDFNIRRWNHLVIHRSYGCLNDSLLESILSLQIYLCLLDHGLGLCNNWLLGLWLSLLSLHLPFRTVLGGR